VTIVRYVGKEVVVTSIRPGDRSKVGASRLVGRLVGRLGRLVGRLGRLVGRLVGRSGMVGRVDRVDGRVDDTDNIRAGFDCPS